MTPNRRTWSGLQESECDQSQHLEFCPGFFVSYFYKALTPSQIFPLILGQEKGLQSSPLSHLNAIVSLKMDEESRDWDEPQLWVAWTGWGPGWPLHAFGQSSYKSPRIWGGEATTQANLLHLMQCPAYYRSSQDLQHDVCCARVWSTGHSRLAHCLLLKIRTRTLKVIE